MADLVHFCLLADRSASMLTDDAIGSLNLTLDRVLNVLATDPLINYHARVGVISFSTGARVERPFATPKAHGAPHTLTAGGWTDLTAGLDLARAELAREVDECIRSGGRPKAPVLFVLTDGRPTPMPHGRPWQQALADLPAGFRPELRPHVLAFGMGDADRDVLREIAKSPVGLGSYIVDRGIDASAAIASFGEMFLQTVFLTITAAAATRPPNPPPGIEELAWRDEDLP
ncbi:hypothetical protein Ait01nite_056690 [Actinoplanes italicus]|uniref:Uncharacterized protein YegL n=1 Tax=Actinoplanes italicus TaxID=113567 RepID=A0A2T0K663_9ACTN|nr:VWA domain-containing protein [Actinoplanes italicus]PRX18219.1 uncharacterized protein YegL [Actinoplanes italicus]GIE32624.1 hypothetical protein Ait01nite_056690 [Actinoplanes italicus]